MDEHTEQENATGTATDAKSPSEALREEATELRAHLDAIGDAYAGGAGPAAVSDEIEKGKERLSKLEDIADQFDAVKSEDPEAVVDSEEPETPATPSE